MSVGMRLTAIVMLALCGCQEPRIEQSETESFRFDANAHERIEIRVTEGHIEVRQGEPGVIEVVVNKQARAYDREQASALLRGLRVDSESDGRTIRVAASSGRDGLASVSGRVRGDIEVRVPKNAPAIELYTLDGRITIRGITASVTAETEDGRVRVSDVSGVLRLRSHDGSIRAIDVLGDVDASTEDGRIELDGRFGVLRAVTGDGRIRIRCLPGTVPSSDWMVRTLDGAIDFAISKGFDASVAASTNDGRIHHTLVDFRGTSSTRRLDGTLGAGGPLILISTMDGRISFSDS